MPTLSKLRNALRYYQSYVDRHPQQMTDIESHLRIAGYVLSTRFSEPFIASESFLMVNNLFTLINDLVLIRKQPFSPTYRLRLLVFLIENSEVVLELLALKKYGIKGKWQAIAYVQFLKFILRLYLFWGLRYRQLQSPAIRPMDRSNMNLQPTLSGLSFPKEVWSTKHDIAEVLHIAKPLLHLAAIRKYGTKSWKPWFLALSIDLFSSIIQDNVYCDDDQREEKIRRVSSMLLYLVRPPFYNYFTRILLEICLIKMGNIPFLFNFSNCCRDSITAFQSTYFYLWTR